MGFFDKTTVNQVGTSVARVLENKFLPNSVLAGAIQGIAEDGSIAEYAMEALLQGIALKADSMYNYAENTYTYGSPSGELYYSDTGRTQVEFVIKGIAGSAALIEYSQVGNINALHVAWMALIASHGYNPATNELGNLSASLGKKAYVKDIISVVPTSLAGDSQPKVLEQWGIPPILCI